MANRKPPRIKVKLNTLSRGVLSRKANARKGGLARAANPENKSKMSEWSRKGGNETLSRHSSEYYKYIRSLRTSTPKRYKKRVRDEAS